MTNQISRCIWYIKITRICWTRQHSICKPMNIPNSSESTKSRSLWGRCGLRSVVLQIIGIAPRMLVMSRTWTTAKKKRSGGVILLLLESDYQNISVSYGNWWTESSVQRGRSSTGKKWKQTRSDFRLMRHVRNKLAAALRVGPGLCRWYQPPASLNYLTSKFV
jgi:hypothetical protein